MASINSPFIVRLHSSFQTTDKLVLVMDYCNGGNLEHHIVREEKFSEEEALFYIPEIVLALEELHKHDIIFRDLKPENVVLDSEGHAKLTDFGLAKMNMRRGQLTQSFCGSVAYMAPEVLKRQGHDKAVDWYCLGAMLYEMLTGSPPHFANTRNKIKENILNNAVQIPENLSPACRDLLQRLLVKDPSQRLGFCSGASEIKSHPFFCSTNWSSVLLKTQKAPSKPRPDQFHLSLSKEEIFGSLSTAEKTKVIEDWPFIQTRKVPRQESKTSICVI